MDGSVKDATFVPAPGEAPRPTVFAEGFQIVPHRNGSYTLRIDGQSWDGRLSTLGQNTYAFTNLADLMAFLLRESGLGNGFATGEVAQPIYSDDFEARWGDAVREAKRQMGVKPARRRRRN